MLTNLNYNSMTKKEELIVGILKKELDYLKKFLKKQEKEIKHIHKNGFDSEMHRAYHMDVMTGLSYTSGYCTGHIKAVEEAIGLLEMADAKEVEDMIAENKRITAENKKYLKDIFADIDTRS